MPTFLTKAATAAMMLTAPLGPVAADVVLINVFEIPDGKRTESIAAWEAARDFLSAEPGYISTTLHEALEPDARFALINIAVWESTEAFEAATARMRAARAFQPPVGLTATPALYRVIRTDEALSR